MYADMRAMLTAGLGLNMGLSTLSSQAHGKGNAAHLNGIYLRQAFLILGIAFIFTTVATIFAEDVLLSFGQPENIAKASADYALVQLAGVPLFWVTAALQVTVMQCNPIGDCPPALPPNDVCVLL